MSSAKCEGCGACCECIVLPLSGKIDAEWCEGRDLKEIAGALVIPSKCKHYDEERKKCKIYEVRPISCKNFPVFGNMCFVCRKWKGIKYQRSLNGI